MFCNGCRHLGHDEYHQLHCWLLDLDPEGVKTCKDKERVPEEEY